ncbi:DUF2498 family protein [Pseudomonas veronii]|uniref:DUF2498 family protein n=1 Tax=Pseudomonas veronii TaxID=76761 RepID=UPI0015A071C0|nr:DUF2498 family protein [Pseudomonas veronii]NWC59478.1 DUF2498 family protein [Pseudomonas veronii]
MKVAMHKAALLDKANEELKAHLCYQEGMQITDVEMQGHILVMQSNGPLMPDTDLNALNDFAKAFSDAYTLIG